MTTNQVRVSSREPSVDERREDRSSEAEDFNEQDAAEGWEGENRISTTLERATSDLVSVSDSNNTVDIGDGGSYRSTTPKLDPRSALLVNGSEKTDHKRPGYDEIHHRRHVCQ